MILIFYRFFAGTVILLVLIGCDEFKDEKIEIWPLKPGNQWIYKVYENNNRDTFYLDTVFVLKDSIFDKEIYHHLKVAKWDFITFNLRYENQSLYAYDNDKKYLFFKYPCAVNDKYISTNFDTVIVKDNKMAIKTAMKSYICIHYSDIKDVNNENGFYLSPGIGVVRFQMDDLIYELYSYDLK